MTFDPTKPVRTRSGHKARIICTDANDPPYAIIALIEDPDDGIENIETYTAEGLYWKKETDPQKEQEPCKNDLVNVPEQYVRYMNVYSTLDQPSYLHKTKTSADDGKTRGVPRVALLELTFEGGTLKSVKIEKD